MNNIYISNFIWRLLERFGAQGVSLVVSIILARLLDPSVYGIVALITVFTAIFNIFIDGGFGNALIQKKDADGLDFSSVFYFNLALSIFMYIILYMLAPSISNFYKMSELIPIIRVMGITIILSGIKNIQQAYISRHMLFKKFFYSTLCGTVGAAFIGILMAYKGYGVWALVTQNLFNQFLDMTILWFTVNWRPQLKFSITRIRQLFSFGWKLLVSNLVYNGYTQLRQLLIGKYYSSSDLAYYNQGDKFPTLISNNINSSIDSILFPAMSSVQENPENVKRMLKKSIQLSQFVVAPCVLGLFACSEEIVKIVLTDKWLPCVPYMQLFCLANVFGFMGNANQNAIIAIGRSDVKLKIEVFKTIFDFAVLFLTLPFGPLYMALGVTISSIIRIWICAYPNKKLLDYSFGKQLLDILPCLFVNLLMVILVCLVKILNFTEWITLLIQILVGIVSYLLFSIIFKLEPFYYVLNVVRNYIKERC